jgi:hypothetical protein
MNTVLTTMDKQELQQLIETIVDQKLSSLLNVLEHKLPITQNKLSSKSTTWLGCMANTGKITGDILSPICSCGNKS